MKTLKIVAAALAVAFCGSTFGMQSTIPVEQIVALQQCAVCNQAFDTKDTITFAQDKPFHKECKEAKNVVEQLKAKKNKPEHGFFACDGDTCEVLVGMTGLILFTAGMIYSIGQ